MPCVTPPLNTDPIEMEYLDVGVFTLTMSLGREFRPSH